MVSDTLADALRDDLAEARRERDQLRLVLHAALDALSLEATAPERYEHIQRELLKERQHYMAATFIRAAVLNGSGA